MHHIQTKILSKLLYAESLTYAAMRPPGIESNQFAYHLEQLLHSGLVAKYDRQYVLAPAGLAFVDRLSQGKMVPRLQPHILTAMQITNSRGQTLLFKRNFQPYIYRLGLPLGKIHMEETIAEAATRELTEKTGLTGIALTHRGMVYLEIKQQDFTISKVVMHLFTGTSDQTLVDVAPKRGTCRWDKPGRYTPQQLMPGFFDVQTLLANQKQMFFAELFARL